MRTALRSLMALLFIMIFVPRVALARNIVQEMIDGVNAVRYQHGLGQLHSSDAMMRAAFYHAQDMANRNYFSHWTLEGWSVQMRTYGQGYPNYLPVLENIGAVAYEPWLVIQNWMSEWGHREVVLRGDALDIGVGHYYNGNSSLKNYWVLIVGGRR